MARIRYYYNPDTRTFSETPVREPEPKVFIVDDTIPAQESNFDDRVYDSRSALNRAAKAHGLVRKDPKERMSKPVYRPEGVTRTYIDTLRQLGLRKD